MNQEFKAYVLKMVIENEKMMVIKKKIEVKVAPEFANLFRKTDT